MASNLFSELQEKLIFWQLEGESDLFIYLNLLRMTQPNKNLKEIGKDEAIYFNFYKLCFQLESMAIALMIPMGYLAFSFYREFKKPSHNPKIVQKGLARLMCVGIPTFNLFLFNVYGRYMHTLPCEKPLMIKYNQELRELRLKRKNVKK